MSLTFNQFFKTKLKYLKNLISKVIKYYVRKSHRKSYLRGKVKNREKSLTKFRDDALYINRDISSIAKKDGVF